MSMFGRPIKVPKSRKKLSRKERIKKLDNRIRNQDYHDLWSVTAILKAVQKLEIQEYFR